VRIGWGFDAHRIGPDGPMMIGGVVVAEDRGLVGTSDGDVALHAVADAILGAAALGDIGTHFPSSDEQWHGADSADILARVVEMARGSGLVVDSVDVTVIAETVRISPYRDAMRSRLADVLELPIDRVSVKATSIDGMGFIGRDEGIAAVAMAMLN
jgi:2-C-methyl-D-erythritol 4-phosphate cytidylyltransferase/2-C-methyl-D-erythritol 2,4-cyclodiphosphate synthase